MSNFKQSWLWPWLLLSTPAVLWAVVALANGYTLEGDNAHIALRSFDIFSANPPLLGMPSTSGNEVEGVDAFHPGPLQFMLLAPFYAVSGWSTWGMTIGSLVINLGLLAIGLWATWRIDSPWVTRAAVTAFAVVTVMMQFAWFTAWNPYPVCLGVLTFLVLLLGIVAGQRGWWPITLFVGSLVIQVHLAGMLLVVPLLAIALILAVKFGWATRPGNKELLVATAVVVVCWVLPIRDMIINWPGNVGAILEYAVGSQSSSDGGGSRMPDLGSIACGVVLGTLAFTGARRSRSFLAASKRSSAPAQEVVAALGLVLTSSAAAFSSICFFVIGSSRGGYLLMFFGVWVMHVLMMRPKETPWWNTWSRATAVIVLVLAVGALASAGTGVARTRDSIQNKVVIETVRELTSAHPETPIVVHQVGQLVWGSLGPATVTDLVVSGRDVYFDHFADREDYDTQRRIERAPSSRLELFVVQQNSDSSWPDIGDHAVLESKEIELPHWDVKVRLVLVDTR